MKICKVHGKTIIDFEGDRIISKHNPIVTSEGDTSDVSVTNGNFSFDGNEDIKVNRKDKQLLMFLITIVIIGVMSLIAGFGIGYARGHDNAIKLVDYDYTR